MARSLCTLQQQIFTDKFDGFMTIISALRQQEGEMDMKGFQNLVSLINTMYWACEVLDFPFDFKWEIRGSMGNSGIHGP
jgi:hypothetical protein